MKLSVIASGTIALVVVPLAAHADKPKPPPRLRLDVELVTQARALVRDGDNLTDLRLERGELGGTVALGHDAAAELRFETIRSAEQGGTLGIDGDSMVARVKYAQVMGGHALGEHVRIDGALGFVPDPWIRELEGAYTLKGLSRVGSERLLGWPTSDLALFGQVSVGPARLAVHVGNGEGVRYPERNDGKTTTAVLAVTAVEVPQLRLDLAAVGRDGSIGAAAIRDQRAGGGASLVTPWVRAGGEVVRAWGVGEQGDVKGWLAEGWAEGTVLAPYLYVSARVATLGFDTSGRTTSFGGAIAVEPWREPGEHAERTRGRVRVWLAVDRVTSSGTAMPIAGADAGDATQFLLIASAVAPGIIQ